MINFGKIAQDTQHICFDVPAITPPNLSLPSLPSLNLSGDLKLPPLPDIKSGVLSFGAKLVGEIQSLESALSQVSIGLSNKDSLSFGLPSLTDFTSKLASLKIPQTICISVGGANAGLSAIFDQINSAISSIPKTNISIPIPTLSIPPISLSGLVPALNVGPIINVDISMSDILSQIKLKCEQYILDQLNGLDPLLRLEQLIQRFQELCGLLQFSQLQNVISQIEQAKAALVQKAVESITDPAEKIAKLYDMAVDAVNAGAYDIVNEISNLIDRLKFDSLISTILKLNPTDAINTLVAEIRQQMQLQNFAAIRQLLTAISIVKGATNDLVNTVFDAPQLAVDELQSEINSLLDSQNFDEINRLLDAYNSAQDALISALGLLDPAALLEQGSALLKDALQKLDLGRFNRIMDQMSQTICNKGTSLLPTLPNVPEINPSSIPSFLR